MSPPLSTSPPLSMSPPLSTSPPLSMSTDLERERLDGLILYLQHMRLVGHFLAAPAMNNQGDNWYLVAMGGGKSNYDNAQ